MSATSSATTLDGAPRTLRLHVWGSSSNVPTLDPTSLYAATLLAATFANRNSTQLQLASATTSLPRVPLLQIIDESNHSIQLIDNVEAIRTFCIASGLDSALSADAELSSKHTALDALIDDHLLDLTLHSLFSLPANFRAVTAPAYSSVGGAAVASSTLAKLATLPTRLQPSIPSRLRNVVETRLTAVGLWGMGGKEASAKTGEADDLAARAGIVAARRKGLGQSEKEAVKDEFERSKLVSRWREVLDVVDAALSHNVLGAEQVASLDAHVFATLAPLVFASPCLPVDVAPRLIKTSYPRLSTYLETLRAQLFSQSALWATQAQVAATPPALTTDDADSTTSLLSYIWPFSPAQKASLPPPSPQPTPTTETRDSKPKPKPSAAAPEDRRLRLGRALWICSALVGLVGYTFASGIVSVRFIDSEELEEGEEQDGEGGEEDDEEEEEEEGEDDEWEVQSETGLDDLDDDEFDDDE